MLRNALARRTGPYTQIDSLAPSFPMRLEIGPEPSAAVILQKRRSGYVNTCFLCSRSTRDSSRNNLQVPPL